MKHTTAKAKVAIGVGALALAAATYYFFGPDGKKHRNSLKGWMIKMKGEIVERMEKIKDLTEPMYHKIVETVAAKYKKYSGADPAEVRVFVDNLKKQWKGFASSNVKTSGRKSKPAPRKSTAKKQGR